MFRLRIEKLGSAPGETRYRARAFDDNGRPLAWRVVATGTRSVILSFSKLMTNSRLLFV